MIRILQIYIGVKDSLDAPLSAIEWEALLQEAVKQSLLGVLYEVIKNLPTSMLPPRKLKIRIAVMANIIAERNELMNRHCEEIVKKMHGIGLECCVLKGQGMAALYPNPQSRTCGDIDLWVKGNVKDTLTVLRSRWKTDEVFYHHTGIHPFGDSTEVEVHFRPSWMNSPFTNRKLQKYFDIQADRQFHNVSGGLNYPITESAFNCVFCAVHICRHLLSEGVGMRQIMDYYYVLRHSTAEERASAAGYLTELKMKKISGALMYVLHECFLLDKSMMIMQPNEKYGRFLMDEIRLSGDFGHNDSRYNIKSSDHLLKRAAKKLSRLTHFMAIAPSEVLWAPCFKTWQHIWRLSVR